MEPRNFAPLFAIGLQQPELLVHMSSSYPHTHAPGCEAIK